MLSHFMAYVGLKSATKKIAETLWLKKQIASGSSAIQNGASKKEIMTQSYVNIIVRTIA